MIDVPVNIKTLTENYNKIASVNSSDILLRNLLFHLIYSIDLGRYIDFTLKVMKINSNKFLAEMGTRGFFGFYYKGKYYLIFNHYDSYPEWLGRIIVSELKVAIDRNRLEEWKLRLDGIKVVTDDIPPTEQDIERLKEYTNTAVSRQTVYDWYCLVHKCQGSLETVLDSGYIYKHADTPEECWASWTECGYVINLDMKKLEFYQSDADVQFFEFTDLPNW